MFKDWNDHEFTKSDNLLNGNSARALRSVALWVVCSLNKDENDFVESADIFIAAIK